MNQGDLATRRFHALLEQANPPTGGLPREELAAEVAPVLPLLSELPAMARADGDYESFEFRECLAVLSLVGRRLALLDLTPTAAIQVVRFALASTSEPYQAPSEGFDQTATASALEGFVLGREERIAQWAEARATKLLTPLRVDEAAFAMIVSGTHEPEALSACVDALGRAMLNADVQAAIVDLTQLAEPNRDRAAAVFSADEVAKMLGGVCWFTGVDSRWRAAAAEAQIPLDEMHLVANLAQAIESARTMTGAMATGARPNWRTLLSRLRR
ncbi:MAG: hypothetical protein WCE62_11640 [Polyangiales bacterium]